MVPRATTSQLLLAKCQCNICKLNSNLQAEQQGSFKNGNNHNLLAETHAMKPNPTYPAPLPCNAHLARRLLKPQPPPEPSPQGDGSLHTSSRIPLSPLALGKLPSSASSKDRDRSPVKLSTAAAPCSVCANGAVTGGVVLRQATPAATDAAAPMLEGPACRPGPGVTPSSAPDTVRVTSGTCGESVVMARELGGTTGDSDMGEPASCCSAKGLGELGLMGWMAAGWATPVADKG